MIKIACCFESKSKEKVNRTYEDGIVTVVKADTEQWVRWASSEALLEPSYVGLPKFSSKLLQRTENRRTKPKVWFSPVLSLGFQQSVQFSVRTFSKF